MRFDANVVEFRTGDFGILVELVCPMENYVHVDTYR